MQRRNKVVTMPSAFDKLHNIRLLFLPPQLMLLLHGHDAQLFDHGTRSATRLFAARWCIYVVGRTESPGTAKKWWDTNCATDNLAGDDEAAAASSKRRPFVAVLPNPIDTPASQRADPSVCGHGWRNGSSRAGTDRGVLGFSFKKDLLIYWVRTKQHNPIKLYKTCRNTNYK